VKPVGRVQKIVANVLLLVVIINALWVNHVPLAPMIVVPVMESEHVVMVVVILMKIAIPVQMIVEHVPILSLTVAITFAIPFLKHVCLARTIVQMVSVQLMKLVKLAQPIVTIVGLLKINMNSIAYV
jgi:hypothetical protein|tara:strand:- start:67 stop:447 length:381 start_codon:yes stop_codon:yes gene_type:complete